MFLYKEIRHKVYKMTYIVKTYDLVLEKSQLEGCGVLLLLLFFRVFIGGGEHKQRRRRERGTEGPN